MPWGSIIGAVGGLLSDGGGGQQAGSTQTISKDPWSAADPWLRQQITTGQGLQGYYQNNPFNQQQQNAYGQLSQGNSYVNALIPSLLSQISNQPGFDRANPRAKPAGINFNAGGNLGFGQTSSTNPVNMNVTNNPFANGGIPAPAAPAAAPAQQDMPLIPIYDGQYILDYTHNPNDPRLVRGGS